jgi:hypothetical protein
MCFPMADVGSLCETDYDCKPRNFCWALNTVDKYICLEKHTAPDRVVFKWDKANYPSVTTAAVLKHGEYC